jgi:pectinesterase
MIRIILGEEKLLDKERIYERFRLAEDDIVVVHPTIQEAIDQADEGDILRISNGHYNEKIQIVTSHITLIGESKESCVITYGDYANKQFDEESSYGTFRTYTCLVLAHDVTLKNLTIKNSSGEGNKVGQAIALFAQGERLKFLNCNFIGHQDTVFCGPLPAEPIKPGSFIGPTLNLPYARSKQFFHQCNIIGDIDYIFGSALAVFHQCKLVTRNRKAEINGYVTAPSTWQNEPYGFVFIQCNFRGEKGISNESVYFGRPWRAFGQIMLINCHYDHSIHREHFDLWGKEENKKTVRFSEYHCSGVFSEVDKTYVIQQEEQKKYDFLEEWHQNQLIQYK